MTQWGNSKNINYILFYTPEDPNFGFCTNFYKTKPLMIDKEKWLSTEQYYQAMKYRGKNASKRSLEYSNIIKESDTPMKSKMLGHSQKNLRFGKKWMVNKNTDHRIINDVIDEFKDVKFRDDWEAVKIRVMIKALIYKFQDPILRKKLISIPDDGMLVEHTSRDAIWGDGGVLGKGTNYLGKILTVLSHVLKYGSCVKMNKELQKEVMINNVKSSDVKKRKSTVVINLKGRKPQVVDESKNEVYIGRNLNMGGWRLKKSKWANPYKVPNDGNITEVLNKYEKYIKEQKLDIKELEGKTLCCWCKPAGCHGDILIKLLKEESKPESLEELEYSFDYVLQTEKSSLLKGHFDFTPEDEKSIYNLKLAQHELCIYGKKCMTARLIGFYSDVDIEGYRFSGNIIEKKTLTPVLKSVLEKVNLITESDFNAILINRYRDNTDYISAHSDSETSLGKDGVVTISLGQERLLRIRDKKTKAIVKDVIVKDSELYWMTGDFQKEFTHEIPKGDKKEDGVRISLTFRHHKY